MPSYVTPKKGVEFIFYISLVSQANSKTMQSNPTIAAGDFKVSIDGGTLNNPSTLPAVTPSSSKMVKVTLSTSEMNGDNITLVCSDASGAEWCDLVVNIQTSARQIDDLAYPATSGRSTAIDASGQVTVGAIANNVITAAAINADAITAAKIADGAIDAATFATGAITAAAIAADAITDAKVASDVTIASVTGAVGSVSGAVGSVTGNVGGNVTGSVGSLATQAKADVNAEVDTALADYDPPTRAELTSDTASLAATLTTIAGYLDTEISAILADTNELQTDWANGGRLDTLIDTLITNVASILGDTGTDGVVISQATRQAIADELLARSAANVEGTAGVYTIAGLIFAAFESSISGATWTIKRSDGSTTFATRTVTTDSDADPIVSVT